MGRLSQVHNDEGNCCRKTRSEPLKRWKGVVLKIELKDGCNNDPSQPAEEVTEDKRSWLSKWDIDGAIAENRRGALSSNQYKLLRKVLQNLRKMQQLAVRHDF